MDGLVDLAAALAPRAFDKLKKVLSDGKIEEAKVSVLISMMIYDQNEKVLVMLDGHDGKIDALQETVGDQGEQLTKILNTVRNPRRNNR